MSRDFVTDFRSCAVKFGTAWIVMESGACVTNGYITWTELSADTSSCWNEAVTYFLKYCQLLLRPRNWSLVVEYNTRLSSKSTTNGSDSSSSCLLEGSDGEVVWIDSTGVVCVESRFSTSGDATRPTFNEFVKNLHKILWVSSGCTGSEAVVSCGISGGASEAPFFASLFFDSPLCRKAVITNIKVFFKLLQIHFNARKFCVRILSESIRLVD
jgi:hypothetical protein